MFTHTRTILLAAVVAVLATAPAASAKKTHDYTSTVTSAPISTANGYPGPGGTAVLRGAITGGSLGPGTVTDFVVITGQPQPNQVTFEGVEVDRFKDGSMGNTFTGTATINADGSQSLVINGRFTPGGKDLRSIPLWGGSGRYRDAAGSYTFTGTVAAGSNEISGTSTGSLTY